MGVPLVLMIALGIIFVNNNRPPDIKLPVNKMPKVNGWDDFVLAQSLVDKRHVSPLSRSDKTPEQFTSAEYAAFLKANSAALAALRAGLAKPYMHPTPKPFDFSPHYSGFRELARAVVGESLYCERIGHNARAVDSRLDCIEFGVTLPRGGPTISLLLGVSVEAIGANGLDPLLHNLGPQDLARVAARMEKTQKQRPPYGDVLRQNGYLGVREFLAAFNGPDRMDLTFSPHLWQGSCEPTGSLLAIYWEKARFSLRNKEAMLRAHLAYCDALALEQAGPYTGATSVRAPDTPMAGLTQELAVIGHKSYAKAEAILAILQTEVALLRYHADHGRYPNTLSALAPKYLRLVPADPCGGKPLKYSALNGGRSFLLYSIGPDLKDDHARPAQKNRTPPDIVAGRI